MVNAIRSIFSRSGNVLNDSEHQVNTEHAIHTNEPTVTHSLGEQLLKYAPQIIKTIAMTGVLAGVTYSLIHYPPVAKIERGEVAIRVNRFSGASSEFREGSAWLMPGVHELRRYSILEQSYHPQNTSKADGEAPFQSIEGLSLGVDLTVRYALDPNKLISMSKNLPADINGQILEPTVQGVIYKIFTRYTVREIFSSKRQEIQQSIEAELKPKLAADGILIHTITIGKIDLPHDYKIGMEKY